LQDVCYVRGTAAQRALQIGLCAIFDALKPQGSRISFSVRIFARFSLALTIYDPFIPSPTFN
jgi:hypothetical protein